MLQKILADDSSFMRFYLKCVLAQAGDKEKGFTEEQT